MDRQTDVVNIYLSESEPLQEQGLSPNLIILLDMVPELRNDQSLLNFLKVYMGEVEYLLAIKYFIEN